MAKDYSEHDLLQEVNAAKELLLKFRDEVEGDEEAQEALVEGETGLIDAVQFVFDTIREDEMLVDGMKVRIDTLNARKQRLVKAIERKKALIEQALTIAAKKSVKLPEATLTMTERASKVVISDEQKIPSQYWVRPDPVIDAKAVAAAIKALGDDDEPIPGTTIQAGATTLTIRKA